MDRRLALGLLSWTVACFGPGAGPGAGLGSVAPPDAPIVADAPAPPTETLAVASWNIERLGHGQKDLSVVAEVLAEFDLVAVQEVMTREVIDLLLEDLPDHGALLTDTPTPAEGKYREFFAFFFRRSRLDPVLNTFVADPDDRFARDPFLACFAVRSGAHLCLMTLHVTYGRRVQERKDEILAIDDALRWAQQADDTSNWVVLGDCNRPIDDGDPDDEPEEEWRELLARRELRVPVVLAPPELPTTLGRQGYANSYDHIFLSEGLAGSVIEAGRFDLVAEVCAGDFERCRTTVSDHAPVFVDVRLP